MFMFAVLLPNLRNCVTTEYIKAVFRFWILWLSARLSKIKTLTLRQFLATKRNYTCGYVVRDSSRVHVDVSVYSNGSVGSHRSCVGLCV